MADDPNTPMDPKVEPPDYKPPRSAEELLERYAKGEITREDYIRMKEDLQR